MKSVRATELFHNSAVQRLRSREKSVIKECPDYAHTLSSLDTRLSRRFQASAGAQERRPTVGVAFGGGSARGLAHVGVVRWFEEHRIPIDAVAGTSMGGLIGGAFSTGMDAAELKAMLEGLDWDELFGSSSFAYKNIRRKADARAYPSRLEFGLKGGIVPPTAINNGGQVDLLLGRIGAAYYDLATFDDLPTPFRAVSVDLLSASKVVIDRGSLAAAMRATMSLPLIFPPVEIDGKILVDGGAMDNVPADVAKDMGVDRVVAINVGDLTDQEDVSRTMLGLAGATLDAMMRASTRASINKADVIINVPLEEFGSLDWRRSAELAEAGYAAAEAMRESLLPLAVSEAEYAAWKARRDSRRVRRSAGARVCEHGGIHLEGCRAAVDGPRAGTSGCPSTSRPSRPTSPSCRGWTATRPSPGGS